MACYTMYVFLLQFYQKTGWLDTLDSTYLCIIKLGMQQLNTFLQNANYKPAIQAATLLLWLPVGVIVYAVVMHTAGLLGRQIRHTPAAGWNKRFYFASVCMIIFIVVLMRLLDVWCRTFTSH
jgi:hypothetical protein